MCCRHSSVRRILMASLLLAGLLSVLGCGKTFRPASDDTSKPQVKSVSPSSEPTIDPGKNVPARDLKGHTAGVTAVSFSPDGKSLASGSMDRTVILWNVAAAEKVRTS